VIPGTHKAESFPEAKVNNFFCFSHPRALDLSGTIFREKRVADACSLLVKVEGFPEVSGVITFLCFSHPRSLDVDEIKLCTWVRLFQQGYCTFCVPGLGYLSEDGVLGLGCFSENGVLGLGCR
jgi:hypothetical protein